MSPNLKEVSESFLLITLFLSNTAIYLKFGLIARRRCWRSFKQWITRILRRFDRGISDTFFLLF